MAITGKVRQGEGVKYTAVLFRVAGNRYKKLELTGYGYAVADSKDGWVQIDNGVMIILTRTEYIEENYGKNVQFSFKNSERFTNDDA